MWSYFKDVLFITTELMIMDFIPFGEMTYFVKSFFSLIILTLIFATRFSTTLCIISFSA